MPIRLETERGDTLIEVLVAISALAVVIVGSFALMNKGVAQMYDSMERSEVRLLINRQIESLTYARDQYFLQKAGFSLATPADQAAANVWIATKAQASLATIPDSIAGCNSTTSAYSIKRDASNNLMHADMTGSGLATGFPAPGNGLWIQQIANTSAPVPYIDFYIRACWQQTGSPQTQVESSVVRLYDK